MTRNVRLVFWVAGALAVALALLVGPLSAGYAVTGISLTFIAVLMAIRAVRAIRDWRLEHPWKIGRRRARATSEEHKERRAA